MAKLMVPKLVVALLVVALSGANSRLASLCTAYCMSSASAASAAHPYQMELRQNPASVTSEFRSPSMVLAGIPGKPSMQTGFGALT